MRETYELLSKAVPSGFGPCRWGPDDTIEERILMKGAVCDGAVVEDLEAAARVFANRIVHREYGETYSVCQVSIYQEFPNGVIVEVSPGEPAGRDSYYLSSRYSLRSG
jgi:hypothetical protein